MAPDSCGSMKLIQRASPLGEAPSAHLARRTTWSLSSLMLATGSTQLPTIFTVFTAVQAVVRNMLFHPYLHNPAITSRKRKSLALSAPSSLLSIGRTTSYGYRMGSTYPSKPVRKSGCLSLRTDDTHSQMPLVEVPSEHARTRSERDALLLLVMFHCLLEIASGSIKEWTYHMNGALMIIKLLNLRGMKQKDVFSQEVVELVYSFFLEKGTFLGTSTSTASRHAEGKYLGSIQWSTEVPTIFPYLAGRGSAKIDPCMGLSFELLDIISCITDLSLRRQTGTTATTQEFTNLIHRLQRLEASSAYPVFIHQVSDFDIMALHASAFQSATWIYLYHALASLPYENEIIQKAHLPVLLSTLEQIHKLHGTLLGFLPYPMWALFIASCVVLEEGRVQILEWFSVLNTRKPVSNVPSTLAAVKAIWKRRDLAECAAPTQEGNKGPVWMDAIGELGWLMPFT
ncbi:uncharacterized protein DSM5745_01163 [Aspergillus mulundensis]|uniref:Zn(II)2Cys6 transcription factor n=1 Tax=Aspergillus mulundensis TaxID=1810919 RepID=A0A3D8T5X7_9EURO|nr:hypothetical protein DSM5745_01163 [Aspergillus mulundensis]RDW93841.1 hypothetical protein DSM5745_01163 [Aspergillus mulundensis]